LPVKPCTITRESLLTSMLIVFMPCENNTEGLNPNAAKAETIFNFQFWYI
jgi:hypothetical protein